VDPIHRALARFLREQRIARDAPVLAAVSGGGDSVALVCALVALGQRVAVAHVHHGLRGAEADADLEFVRDLAARMGVPFASERVRAAARDGDSPEARARRLRYAALERMRAALGCAWVATAHTLDDQAETLLLRGARGTGLRGLAGVAPRDDARRLLRPLLESRRAALRDYLRRRGQACREDSTNAGLATPRNRVRASVLPALEALAPGAARRLASLAGEARETERFLGGLAEDALARILRADAHGLRIDRAGLCGLPDALRARVWLALLERAGLGARASRAAIERADRLARDGASGARLGLPGGLELRARKRELNIQAARASTQVRKRHHPMETKGERLSGATPDC
jgi:tRNA(Ile)-lysidine synthase